MNQDVQLGIGGKQSVCHPCLRTSTVRTTTYMLPPRNKHHFQILNNLYVFKYVMNPGFSPKAIQTQPAYYSFRWMFVAAFDHVLELLPPSSQGQCESLALFLLLAATMLLPYLLLLEPLAVGMVGIKWEMCGRNQTFVVASNPLIQQIVGFKTQEARNAEVLGTWNSLEFNNRFLQ